MHDDTINLRQPDAAELRTWFGVLDAAFADEFSDAEFELERTSSSPIASSARSTATPGSGPAPAIRSA